MDNNDAAERYEFNHVIMKHYYGVLQSRESFTYSKIP